MYTSYVRVQPLASPELYSPRKSHNFPICLTRFGHPDETHESANPQPCFHGAPQVEWRRALRVKCFLPLRTVRGSMLELRPNCECCNKDLPPSATDAMICTFECTFCRDCVDNRLGGRCPNCGGNLVSRPIRPLAKLAANPPSTVRVFKPQGCGQPINSN